MNYFNRNIETLRKKNGLSQATMGERYGISQTGFSRWEKSTVPDLDTIIDLAKFFKVSIDDLLTTDLSDENTHTHLLGAGPLLLEPGQEGYFSEQEMEAIKMLERELQQQRDMMSKLMQEIGKMRQELVAQKSEIDALKRSR